MAQTSILQNLLYPPIYKHHEKFPSSLDISLMLMVLCSLIVQLTIFNIKVELIFYGISKVANTSQTR